MVGLGTLVCVIEVHECLFRIAGDHDLEKFPNMTIRSCRKKQNWICPRFRYNEWPPPDWFWIVRLVGRSCLLVGVFACVISFLGWCFWFSWSLCLVGRNFHWLPDGLIGILVWMVSSFTRDDDPGL